MTIRAEIIGKAKALGVVYQFPFDNGTLGINKFFVRLILKFQKPNQLTHNRYTETLVSH
jgi:hypothetical protein